MPAAPDRHTDERHVHLDHVYVATTSSHRPATEPEHHVRWFTSVGITGTPAISEDSRLLAARLLTLAAPQPGPRFKWLRHQGNDRVTGWPKAAGSPSPPPRAGNDSPQKPRLIVIRGNSASGKSAVAAAIRQERGQHDLSIVSQDLLRRVVLREHDAPGGANIALIDMTARFAIASGFHVIVEGILRTDHYGDMLTKLIRDHAGNAYAYFLDVPFAETLRRHTTKAEASEYGEKEMRAWYRGLDLLPGGIEQVIPEKTSLEETVRKVMADTGLHSGTDAQEAPPTPTDPGRALPS